MVDIPENSTWGATRTQLLNIPSASTEQTLTNKTIDTGDNDLLGADGVRIQEVASFAALATVTSAMVAEGDHITVKGVGRYQRALDSDVNPHLDYSGGSGVKWNLQTGAPLANTLEALGATVDGTTNNATQLARARVTGGAIDLGEDTYYISTQEVITENGTLIRGVGRGRTKLILDAGSDAGLLFDAAQYCAMMDMTIQGNDTSAPLIQLGDGSGVTYSCAFDRVRFVGNSGGARPAISETAHVAVRGIEATSGNANYFHRFNACEFDSLYAAFDVDYNANAWQLSNNKMQNVWRCFKGGFQEWMVTNTFWHSSAGSGSDYAIFAELSGKNSSNKCQYNSFINTKAEPGATLTRYLELDANTQSNYFEGDHQCTQHGNDAGTANNVLRPMIGRYDSGSSWNWRYTGDMTLGYTGGTGDVILFGNGTTSYTGGQRKLVLHGGFSSETRRAEIWQQAGGNMTLQNYVAGSIAMTSVGDINLSAANNLNISGLPTSAAGLSAGDIWNDSGTLKIV